MSDDAALTSTADNVDGITGWCLPALPDATLLSCNFAGGGGSNCITQNSVGHAFFWAVHDDDAGIAPVPLPAGVWLMLSGLLVPLSRMRRK